LEGIFTPAKVQKNTFPHDRQQTYNMYKLSTLGKQPKNEENIGANSSGGD
jgi:hypothetical protein